MINRGAESGSLLRRKDKIKSKSEISLLFKTGQKRECFAYTIIYKKNNRNFDRFAVIVSRKLGNAVKRNNIKRVFREIFRLRKKSPPYYDILIQPRSGIKIENKETLKSCFELWNNSTEK